MEYPNMNSYLVGLFAAFALGCVQAAVTRTSWESGGRQEALEHLRMLDYADRHLTCRPGANMR